MDSRAVAEAFFAAFEVGDFDTVASYMSDDFQFSGATPQPTSGQAWMGLSARMRAAFPDLRYNFRVEEMDGNVASVYSQLSGTHTEDFDLTNMGMGVIPPTGKSFSLPSTISEAVVEGDKVTSVHVNSSPEGGVAGILSQLGVAVS